MSTHLAFYPDSIPLGYSILQTQNVLVGNLVAHGWQLLAQVDSNYSDLIPPSSESIGNSKFREVVRIYISNTAITIGSYQKCIADAFPQSIRLTAKTAGAVAASVTIDGATVTGAAGSAGSTANDNLRALFYALKDSADATIMGWDHWYNGTDTIICTNKTITTGKGCSGNTNITYSVLDAPVLAGAESDWARLDVNHGYPVTIDLANGFVYFMQVNARSFLLGTKCLSGFTGAVFASYLDHTEAMAQVPDSPRCSPIELVVGTIESGANQANGKVTHYWSSGKKYSNRAVNNTGATELVGANTPTGDWHSFTGGGVPMTPQDCTGAYSGYLSNNWEPEIPLGHLGVGGGNSNLGSFVAIPVGTYGYSFSTDANYAASTRWTGSILLPDINKWSGGEPNETCAMVAPLPPVGVNGTGITLQQALDDSTAYPTILLSTVSGLPGAGGVVIGIEEFTYTGTSGGNTITGVARAANGTTAARHFINETVSVIQWYIKINTGALHCGSNKPF